MFSILDFLYYLVYWASGLFCLRVHHEVDKILGSYLCRGKEEVRGGVKVAWMKMCLPFKEGGFVIRDESSWNIAREVVGMAEDVEYGLIRGCRGVPYLSRIGFRMLVCVLVLGIDGSGFLVIRGRGNVPKYSFYVWLAIKDRLETRDRLHRSWLPLTGLGIGELSCLEFVVKVLEKV
ncbi:zf-RVT domain-containing protein [Cucumis melo var. makuwa]|uniref:Zf-RVT domain-containing protein n=1 Tax=Cucumis melo var. makuwa TaxID=1194695 RepID=A0A5A7SNM8_CUCMM|nr:zf-RVT domain-containing protein [Cucumis melo var. makuwa]